MKKKRSTKAGMPPGTPVLTGTSSQKTTITLMNYDGGKITELTVTTPNECESFLKKKTVTWINVDGLGDISLLEDLGKVFGLHPLVVEDILDTGQRPKLEDYDDYLYLVLKMLRYSEKSRRVETEQVSLVLGRNFVLSFQEVEGDIFNKIRERIRNRKGRIRRGSADFLTYSLIDAVVDNYFLILEDLGERIEFLEEILVKNPGPKTLRTIHNLKREMIVLRRSVWPLREVVGGLERESRNPSPLVKKETAIYLRDVYDHTVQVVESIETSRDIVSGMIDIYLSSISHKLNEVMKVLTIIGTIFIPLTFITGVYGMNFHFMPELAQPLGYFGIWLVMISIALIMILYFRRKGWM